MKKFICSAALLLCAAMMNAQDNYTIKMSLKIEGMPAEYAAYGEQEITTYVKGDKTKTEMTSMMGSNKSYFDGKNLTSLNDMMGNKSGFTASKEEMEKMDKKGKEEAKPKVEYTTEKKTIAGYECTKALVKSVDNDKKENVITVWVTDKLKPTSPEARKARKGAFDLGDLKGQPLALEAAQSANGMDVKIIMTATEVSTNPLDDSVFTPNTSGYKMMTYSEYMEKMKAMQGGK
jgi:hypothetical protein